MFEKLKFLFFSFLTIRHEVKYVTGALIDHKIDLPKNYWRFTLLRPFINVDKGNSALMRNFCPLFWVTNLLAALYIVFSPLILVLYPTIRGAIGLVDWIAGVYVKYQAKKASQPATPKEEEEKPGVKLNLKFKFTGRKVFQLFWDKADTPQEMFCYLLEDYEDQIKTEQGEGSTFKIEDITEDQLYKLAEEGIKEIDKMALIFVFQYRQEWREKFTSFMEEITGAQKRKEARRAAFKENVEKRFQKVMPKLVSASKGLVFGLGVVAVVALVAVVGWGVYLWFFPVLHGIVSMCVVAFNYLTSVEFLKSILYLLGAVVGFFVLWGVITLPMMMFEDKITEWCESYYVKADKRSCDMAFTPFHTVGKNRVDDGGYKLAFFLMFICKLFDVLAVVLGAIISVVIIPFVFIKMFYAKNCPSITVINPDADTDTNTQSEDP